MVEVLAAGGDYMVIMPGWFVQLDADIPGVVLLGAASQIRELTETKPSVT